MTKVHKVAIDTGQIPTKNLTLEQGTSFPLAPVLGQKFFRTDIPGEYVCTNPTGPVWTRADVGGTLAVIPDASDTVKGLVELATSAEVLTGTDAVRAVTPAGLQAKIDALVASAPGLLNTLDELANALGDDPNFATTVTNLINGKQASDATLTALAALVTSADKMIYATGVDAFALADLTAKARTFIALGTSAQMRSEIAATGKYSANNPALTAGVWSGNITHNLGNGWPHVSFFDPATSEQIILDVKVIDANNIQIRADVAVAVNTVIVSVLG